MKLRGHIPIEVDGRKLLPMPKEGFDYVRTAACRACVADREDDLCGTLPCRGVVWVDHTPENWARFVALQLKGDTS